MFSFSALTAIKFQSIGHNLLKFKTNYFVVGIQCVCGLKKESLKPWQCPSFIRLLDRVYGIINEIYPDLSLKIAMDK